MNYNDNNKFYNDSLFVPKIIKSKLFRDSFM